LTDVATEFAYIESLGVEPSGGRALDFGCGLGRLTQPLAERFDEAVGVDIAASMIEGARRQSGGRNPVERFLMKYAPIQSLFWLVRHRQRQPSRITRATSTR